MRWVIVFQLQNRNANCRTGGLLKPDCGLSGDVHISQLCHPDRNRSSQSDDLWSGGTLCLFGEKPTGGPLKPGFGLVGMFIRHRLGPTNKLDFPHAMATNAFSPQRAEPFRHFWLFTNHPIRLLRDTQSLRAGSGCSPRTQADDSSSQL